jgi:two-component system, OmpR family, sensor kinase
MVLKSIRWRLQIWYGLIFAILLSAFGITAFQLEKNRRLRLIDQELQVRVNAILGGLRPDRRGGPGPGLEFRGPPPEGEGRPIAEGPEFRDGPGSNELPPDGPGSGRERDPNRPGGPGGRGPRGSRAGMDGLGGGPMGRPPGEFRPSLLRPGLFDTEDTNSFYYVIWRREEVIRSTNAPVDVPKPVKGPPTPAANFNSRAVYREAVASTPPGDLLVVGRSILRDRADLRRLGIILGTLATAFLLCGLAGGWWIATKAIQPIDQISSTALKISSGDLSQRIPTSDTETELGRLASVLNSTFARLEAAFGQQGRFTSDAAHELRTPLTVMLTQTQSALARERPASDYRESLESCQRAAQRMRKLLDSLLELARLDAGQEEMKRMKFDLAEVAKLCAASIEPLATEKKITITCDLPPLAIEGDPERLDQVLTNILSNAIFYNQEGGKITINGADFENELELSICDTGQGIAPEDLPHIFERFYRADKSRTGRSGRTGLGLAISKALVEAHSGSINVASTPGQGTTFTLRLPKVRTTGASPERPTPQVSAR